MLEGVFKGVRSRLFREYDLATSAEVARIQAHSACAISLNPEKGHFRVSG
jgi:hypothetical protein